MFSPISSSDIIKMQRFQASLSVVSEEMKTKASSQRRPTVEIPSYWDEEFKSFGLGYVLLLQYIKENPGVRGGSLTIEDCQIHIKELKHPKNGSITLQESIGKSSDVMLVYYRVAQIFFEEKKYHEAQNIFTFLGVMNQYIPSFWIGRGVVNESLENWDKALEDYWTAESLDHENPLVFQGLIRIYKKLNDKESLAYCHQLIEKSSKLKKLIR